jgi:hypothetical protein
LTPELPEAVDAPPDTDVAGRSTPAAQPRTSSSRSGATRHWYGESVADLVESGRLSVGDVLSATHRGSRYEVVVESDGRLRAGTDVFDSPSQAARLLSDQKAVNGWVFWATAEGTPISDLRGS